MSPTTAGIREPILPGLSEPEDIAGAVAFLGSEYAERITDTTLPVDGDYLSEGIHDLSF
jgi:NAD(P)-dependent dehydrogenase (short-subunit alcohol dehydrogenase family)